MKITKLGHCCLLIEENGARILTDPGNYSTAQNDLKDLDAIVITHEHADHFHLESIKIIIQNNPHIQIYTNRAVGPLLEAEHIAYTLIEDGQTITIKGVEVQSFEQQHAEIYHTLPRVLNTGFLVGETLFYPGDAFIEPDVPVKVLACPMAGPWMKISEAIDYAKAVKPTKLFPVHDGAIIPASRKISGMIAQMLLKDSGIEIVTAEPEKPLEV